MVEYQFAGQAAVVTGGARGIGLAIARQLAKNGARVAVADIDQQNARTAADSITADGGRAGAFAFDVADPESVENGIDAILSDFGRIDILVNNAGIVGRTAPVQQQRTGDWNRILATDLSGVFYCCRAVIPHMLERGSGRIVNISSVAGKEGNPNMVPYCTAKAGVIGLTKALAKEVARSGVLVNAVTPALIDTPMVQDISEDQIEYLTDRIPIGRLGTAEEVAAMVCWLASDAVSFSTGAVFDISGGRATY